MKKVYLSSTYKDLAEHRSLVATALRRTGYEVVHMEEYAARDQRTRAACEADVANCDLYVGIFAWRYGHIPPVDNQERLSITELEYRKALGEKTCLTFLLSDDAPWPSTLRDAEMGEGEDGQRIRRLRAELKTRCSAYFSTPESLAIEVMAAVSQHEARKRTQRLEFVDEVRKSVGLGPSYFPNIQAKLAEVGNTEIVEINLGPTPWWTTRLHLVAALASDFTRIRQLLFLDADGRFLSMASPVDVRRALTRQTPELEHAYLQSRRAGSTGDGGQGNDIDRILADYEHSVFIAFENRSERDVKHDVTPEMLRRELGIESAAEAVEDAAASASLQRWEILRRGTPFVVLLRQGRVQAVFDRVEMASRIAVEAVQEAIV